MLKKTIELDLNDMVVGDRVNGLEVVEISDQNSVFKVRGRSEWVETEPLRWLGIKATREMRALPDYLGAVVEGRENAAVLAAISADDSDWFSDQTWITEDEVLELVGLDWVETSTPPAKGKWVERNHFPIHSNGVVPRVRIETSSGAGGVVEGLLEVIEEDNWNGLVARIRGLGSFNLTGRRILVWEVNKDEIEEMEEVPF